MKPSTCLILAASCAFGGHAAFAQSARAERLEVTPAGAFARERAPSAVRARGSAPNSMQSAGSIWTHTDGGQLWIPRAVSIGNHGSEVFAEYNLNNERAELFSAFDANPPTALWSDPAPLDSDEQHVASAEDGSVHLALHVFHRGQPNATCVLRKYSAQCGGVADWRYTFPIPADGANLAVSRDGRTIVAIANDYANSSVAIAVLSPDSNVPLSYTTVALGGTNNGVRGLDLSADGSTLYFSSGWIPVVAYVFDIASAAVVFSTPINVSFDSHAISGDGSVFAFGDFGALHVFEKVAGVYTNTFTRALAGTNFCSRIDISDDGSTIAAGWTFYDYFLTTQIEAYDIPSRTLTMSDVVTSTNISLQNTVSSVSISADGQRFGVGLWGDGTGSVAELRLYARDQNAPIATRNLNGSVFSLKISADGQRVVAGSKSVHANQPGNGGQVDLFGDATPFTNFCFPGQGLARACPCANNGVLGHGCENSADTGGALLTAAGSVSADTVALTASGELPGVTSIVFQGSVDLMSGSVFGDGVRCVGGVQTRLYTQVAVNGVVVAPGPGDPSIRLRSAALGDPIGAGQTRSYQVYYRDPTPSFCSSPIGDAWNVSNAVRISW